MGRLTLDLTSLANTAVATHDATETIIGIGPSTVIHDQHLFNTESRLAAELGITSWLAADLIVPFRVFDTSIRYLDTAGQQVQIENPFIHHHNETLAGPGDPWLLGRAAMHAGGFTVGTRIGVTIPLGRTEPDPFLLGDMGLPHEHSQFGTGTFEPVFGLDAARTFGGVRVETFALTVQSLYVNGHAYLAGDRYAAGLGAASALGTKRWRFRATVEAQHETAEQWHGMTQTSEGNIGRTDVLAGAEVMYRVNDDWHLAASLKVPAYTHVVGGQLDASPYLGFSIGTQFHVFEGADEHHHAHAEDVPVAPGDWTGLDMQQVSTAGGAPALVPVPGKITVFDFWATWCKPCGVVDHELAEVVRRHPNDIAVRKLDVSNVDSPASIKYVGAVTLPHFKVFGRDGKLLWEHSAAPLVMTGEIEQLITGPIAKAKPVAGAVRVAIDVGDAGFVPERVRVPRGKPVTLVFTRHSEKTCATDVHFVLPDGTRVDEQLPLGQAVEIPIRVEQVGDITYSCGMNMNHGTIEVK